MISPLASALAYAARHGTWVMAGGLVAGFAVPPLAAALKQWLLETIDVKPALPPVKYVALCKKERQSALFASIIDQAREVCDFTLAFQAGK